MSKASGRHKDKKGPLFWGSGSFECPLREKVGGSTKIIGKLESWVVARGWFKLLSRGYTISNTKLMIRLQVQ